MTHARTHTRGSKLCLPCINIFIDDCIALRNYQDGVVDRGIVHDHLTYKCNAQCSGPATAHIIQILLKKTRLFGRPWTFTRYNRPTLLINQMFTESTYQSISLSPIINDTVIYHVISHA